MDGHIQSIPVPASNFLSSPVLNGNCFSLLLCQTHRSSICMGQSKAKHVAVLIIIFGTQIVYPISNNSSFWE